MAVGSSVHGNESSDSIIGGELSDQLSDYQFRNKDSEHLQHQISSLFADEEDTSHRILCLFSAQCLENSL
jgi:hypothetical protein